MDLSPHSPLRVLYVEDDERLASLTARYLESHGLLVAVARNGIEGDAEAIQTPPDVVLLDLMLPGIDGRELCRRLRERSDVPIIMVTARGEESARVIGLEDGADDYMTKPFSARELLARIRAVSRRARGHNRSRREMIEVCGLRLESLSRRAMHNGTELTLTTYEFGLLLALAENAGKVLKRERLMELVRGSSEEAFDRSIDVHISHLRQKLGDDPRRPRLLKTVRGFGYMLALHE